MSAAVRRLLAVAALVVGVGLAAGFAAGPRGDAMTDTTRTVGADPLDTSWGDHYTRPEL
ncbi:hypothetical protein [Streptomyces sp. NPDC101160]|uniref:hypothetical protein n=1 Tax=Streptomyces sp. NPDC101160 TaxID=3366118 RepID=UPI00382297A3